MGVETTAHHSVYEWHSTINKVKKPIDKSTHYHYKSFYRLF